MRILAFNAGHDGAAVFVHDGSLVFSYESEQNGFRRHATLTASTVVNGLAGIDELPEIIAVSGWVKGSDWRAVEAGYFGVARGDVLIRPTAIAGRPATYFSSTHEKSHLFAAYGLSPFPQGQPCYALVWEGSIGRFYEIDAALQVTPLGTPLTAPGHRYAALFALADPAVPVTAHAPVGAEYAGKLMALAAFGRPGTATTEEDALIRYLLDHPSLADGDRFDKCDLRDSPWCNVGVEADGFADVAVKHSNALFDRFYQFASRHLTRRHPLLVSGGCGLNGEWNSRWRASGLFSEVFVPPCPNDAGSAIGAAVEAMFHFTGQAKLTWRIDADAARSGRGRSASARSWPPPSTPQPGIA
jgi:hydroxymethyl cephem carbamoyltransferase